MTPDRAVGQPTSAQQRLLDAAIEALRDLDATALLNAIGVREIARRAGTSTASLYTHYGSLSGLAEAVITRIFDLGEAPIDQVSDLLDQIKEAHFPLQTAYAFHAAEFQRLTTDPEFSLWMGLWAFGGANAAPAYRGYLNAVDQRLTTVAAVLFAAWGRELRPPFDLTTFLAAQVALVNGATLRHLVDPGTLDIDQFKRAASILTYTLMRVRGDRHSVDDRLAELNYYPIDHGPGTTGLTDRSRATRARILRAASILFTTHGYEQTTITQIAAHADTGTSTVHEHFSGKPGIAVALFRQQAAEHLALANDRADLVTYLTELAAFIAPRATYAGPYLYELLTKTTALTDVDPVLDQIETLIRQLPAATQEQFSDIDPTPVSELLLIALVRRVINAPADGAAVHAGKAIELVLPGV